MKNSKTAAEMGLMAGSPPADEKLVTRENWGHAPANRWAFQHASEILHTANISRGSGPVAALAQEPRNISLLGFDDSQGEQTNVQALLHESYTDGFIVLREGAIIFETYLNGMRPDTKHILQSVSKSVTGMLAGALVHNGRLDPNAQVTDIIPELAESAYGDATVRQVLDMTVSVVWREEYDDPESEVSVHESAMLWADRDEVSRAGDYSFLTTLKKDERKHGELFHYASCNTDVLGWLIERTSGQRFADFFSDQIWSKLGADHDSYITVDERGSPAANGGFAMTLRDLARFGQMVLDEGRFNGAQVVPSGWILDTRHNGDNAAWRPHPWADATDTPNGFYRNQWYVTGKERGVYFAVGVYGQLLWIDPTTRVVIAKCSSWDEPVNLKYAGDALLAVDAVARALADSS